jgi:hypothetical protein
LQGVVLPDLIYEVSLLLKKVQASEDFVVRAEAYFREHHQDWSKELAGIYLDTLERKKDQIDYEWYLIGRMGDAIAKGESYITPET